MKKVIKNVTEKLTCTHMQLNRLYCDCKVLTVTKVMYG